MEKIRDGVIGEVAGYLLDSISVNLVGMKGSGRSTVAKEVADQLRQRGVTVVSVFGVAALRDRPLAALAASRVEMPLTPAGPTVGAAVAALSKQLAGSSVLVVDDADELDSASLGAIVAAHVHQRFPILAVTRPAGQGAATSLLGDVPQAVRLTLSPLPFDELHRAVHDLLPGPVDPSTVAQIATLSGGLPRLMNAIVDTGRRTGAIAEVNGVWRAGRCLWDERLAQTVEPLLSDLTDDGLGALTEVAVAGSMSAGYAIRAMPDGLFDRLCELGLLQVVDTSAGPQVTVFPPLLINYLREAGQAATRSEALPGAGPALTDARAAIMNMRIAEQWQAEADTLRTAWSAQPDAQNAAVLIAALIGVDCPPGEVAAVIDGTRLEGSEPRWVARFVGWQAAFRALEQGDRVGARESLGRYQAELPQFAMRLRTADAILQVLTGTIPGDDYFAQGARPGDRNLDAVRRLVAALNGRTLDALDGDQRPELDGAFFAETHDVAISLARVLHGDFDAGVEWALQALDAAEGRLNPGELQAHVFVAALGLAFAGRFAELQALLGPALALNNGTMLHRSYQSGLLALAATAAGWFDQTRYGESLMAQSDAIGPVDGPFRGLVPVVEPAAWQTVDRMLAAGQIAAGVIYAVAAVEAYPDAGHAAVVAERAAATQSPLLAALGGYVRAAGDADVAALATCISDLWRLGARVFAVRAAVTRALVLRGEGDLTASIRASEDAWARSEELGRPCPGLFYRLNRAVDLSAREREVGLALARDETPTQIAASLNLSLRTIENYLSSAYRKLGSEGRADLARAVSTWAS